MNPKEISHAKAAQIYQFVTFVVHVAHTVIAPFIRIYITDNIIHDSL